MEMNLQGLAIEIDIWCQSWPMSLRIKKSVHLGACGKHQHVQVLPCEQQPFACKILPSTHYPFHNSDAYFRVLLSWQQSLWIKWLSDVRYQNFPASTSSIKYICSLWWITYPKHRDTLVTKAYLEHTGLQNGQKSCKSNVNSPSHITLM